VKNTLLIAGREFRSYLTSPMAYIIACVFLVLFGACAGIVAFTVWQFVMPIRKLEQRADGMARGELAEPVSSGGEGDEVGRLTFALEEMRRALREKLRSTEEVNLDLERAVQRRTADLAKKNRELAEALDKLTRAQDQLVRSEKMASIGQLVAGIAHEINTPIGAVNSMHDTLFRTLERMKGFIQQELPEDCKQFPKLEAAFKLIDDSNSVIKSGTERVMNIVTRLRSFARLDEADLKTVDIHEGIEDTLVLIHHELKHNITVVKNYGNVPPISCFPSQLNQVFLNLLVNSKQAIKDKGTITITTFLKNKKVHIKFSDDGVGIPPESVSQIFDPGYTTKGIGVGTGLGLSISYNIIQSHRGEIKVSSELGKGTEFLIVLPMDLEAQLEREKTKD